uniref:Uncharacterized protein n=1 Tax=Heterorhabditis bacteriophora TaxID=37862 RepID=A0A1I7XSW4_HETBA
MNGQRRRSEYTMDLVLGRTFLERIVCLHVEISAQSLVIACSARKLKRSGAGEHAALFVKRGFETTILCARAFRKSLASRQNEHSKYVPNSMFAGHQDFEGNKT